MISVLICVAAYDNLPRNLMGLIKRLEKNDKYIFRYIIKCSPFVDRNRNDCITKEQGNVRPELDLLYDYALFIDTDMEPKYSDIIEHVDNAVENNFDVLGALYLGQGRFNGEFVCVGFDDKRINHHETDRSLKEVPFVGMGFTIIKWGLFEKLPFPWFDAGYDKNLEWICEDVYFCNNVRDADMKIHCDFGRRIFHKLRTIKSILGDK